MKLQESRLGARLDTLTDNLVHLALFIGLMTAAIERAIPGHTLRCSLFWSVDL